MAILNDLSGMMDRMVKGAQKTAELTRLQRLIAKKQGDFDDIFEQIGKLYYSLRQQGKQPDKALDQLCDQVDALAQEIAGLKDQVDTLRQVRRCPNCGAEQPDGNIFCSACGTKLPEKPTPAAAEPEEPTRDVFINWPDGNANIQAEETAAEAQAPAPEAAEPTPAAQENTAAPEENVTPAAQETVPEAEAPAPEAVESAPAAEDPAPAPEAGPAIVDYNPVPHNEPTETNE